MFGSVYSHDQHIQYGLIISRLRGLKFEEKSEFIHDHVYNSATLRCNSQFLHLVKYNAFEA